jgi:hypothetical protein
MNMDKRDKLERANANLKLALYLVLQKTGPIRIDPVELFLARDKDWVLIAENDPNTGETVVSAK